MLRKKLLELLTPPVEHALLSNSLYKQFAQYWVLAAWLIMLIDYFCNRDGALDIVKEIINNTNMQIDILVVINQPVLRAGYWQCPQRVGLNLKAN